MFFGNPCASWFGIYRSTDLGLNWVRHTFLSVEGAMVYLRDGSILAGCYEPGLGSFGIYKTTNNGDNWINTNTISGLDYPSDFVVDTNDDIYVFIGGLNFDGVYLSSNNGNSWENYGLSGYHPVTCLAIDSSGYVWAGAHQDGVYKTAGRTVPVELASFSAEVNSNNVLLSWITASELNNQGFEIERNEKREERGTSTNEGWEIIGFVGGNGTTTEINYYTFIDSDVNDGTFSYRLKQIDFDGSFEYSNVVEVEFGIPLNYYLSQNYPNPFNPGTTIPYRLKSPAYVKIMVYNILGELVRVLVNHHQSAGYYEVDFIPNSKEKTKGTEEIKEFETFYYGDIVSGIYLYRIEVIGEGNIPVFSDMKKMMMVK